ncbi:hypothetical protein ABW21_db0201278 [Orbilia brochopaga]|nr:hypothetical protein ABW21_db0201278 [Drechslerella brochopaga]
MLEVTPGLREATSTPKPVTPPPSQRKIPVLLLKTKSSPTDPYDVLFSSTGSYEPIFVPVLQHRFDNADAVKRMILDRAVGAADDISQGRFAGLVITSQRTVEALAAILEDLKKTNGDTVARFLNDTRIYIVGPATCTALVNLGFRASHVVGGESGNGAALADFIIDDYITRHETRDLLFLVGETHNTVIPIRVPEKLKELGDISMTVDEVVVYRTGVAENFADEFRGQLERLDQEHHGEGHVAWVVVFSPTGTDAALERFRRRPEAVAKTPSPEGLLEAVGS